MKAHVIAATLHQILIHNTCYAVQLLLISHVCGCRFVGRFMNRRERLEQMGDKMKKFNNVYIKNFSEDIDDEKLKDWFEIFGKIISAKVSLTYITRTDT